MEENKVYEGDLEETEIVSEVTDESLEPIQPSDSDYSEIVTTEDDPMSDLLSKLLFAAGATAVGAGCAYVANNRKKIKKNLAEKAKAKAEKKLAKQAKKIAKADEVLKEFEEPKAIPEECDAVTVTTAE